MPFRSASALRSGLTLALLAVFLAAPVLAQQEPEYVPPPYDVPAMEHVKPWLPWLAGMLLVAVALAISFKNPHRSHLD